MKVVENRWKFAVIPALVVVLGIVLYIVHGGFNFDVEFLGGTRMQVELNSEFDNDELAKLITDETGASAKVQKSGTSATQAVIKVQATDDDDATRVSVMDTLKDKYSITDDQLISSSTASASFGMEVQRKALLYTLLAIICILIYIAIRFEWRSAVMAVIALAINVIVMAAVYSITNIALNTTFIAAMLTVVGYSINNTIVIFDRIRENMKGRKKNNTVTDIVDRSVAETMGRTINSTITTLITIVLIYIMGVSAIREFALPLIVGILAGAYTSIFIASSFWAVWKESEIKARAEAAAERRSTKKGNK
jgi:preprotein translocase SecF subunit